MIGSPNVNRLSGVLIGSPNVNRVSGVLIGSPNVNRVSGVLIGFPNAQRTHVESNWILENIRLTLCFHFVLSGEQDSVHS